MGNVILKEDFVGKYDGVTPAALLGMGAIADGLNVRKVSAVGGWKPRKGCTLNNTTAAESGTEIKSLHKYEHPRHSDYHFIAQVNNKLLDASNDPPAAGTTFGSTLGVTVGTTPGFSCVVNTKWFYCDGSNRPVVFDGDTPYPIGVFSYDNTDDAYSDYLRKSTDGLSDTYFKILAGASDKLYILTSERCEGITLDLDDVNSNAVTLTVKAWRSGSWTAVSNLSDGTETGGTTTLAQDGSITWDRSTSDDLKVIGNVMGYAYELSWSGALSDTVTGNSITTVQDADHMTNKWDGKFEWVTGARFYDQSAGEYQEIFGKVSNESDSQYVDISEGTTSDFLYFKTPEPITGVGIGVAVGYANTANAQVDLIEYWDGTDWADISTLDDTTLDNAGDSSFSQTGRIFFDATSLTPEKRTFEGDEIPGYWYRISWDAALSTDVRIYALLYAAQPETLEDYKGCIEFKGRLLLWGPDNRLQFSVYGRPDCFCGIDSGYTDTFGGEDPIICAVKFYNELMVFKEREVYLLEGYSPSTFGVLKLADGVGLSSPKTAISIEVGFPSMNEEEPTNVVIWQDVDGVYVADGRKPKKVSDPSVDNYFNPEYTDCIAAGDIDDLQAFPDKANNEYHLLLPTAELVYNIITDEWYPPWEREVDLVTGISLKGTDGRFYTYGGTSGGYVHRLENDTTDKDNSNSDVAITHKVKTRALANPSENSPTPSLKFKLRKLWAIVKARVSGTITTKTYKNMASTGTTQSTPSAMSLVASGQGLAVPELHMSIADCLNMQFEFTCSTADVEMEIWGIAYEIEARTTM